MKLLLMVGISNCGKSTWAENYCNENPNTVNVSRDFYRYGHFNEQFKDKSQHVRIESEIEEFLSDDCYFAALAGKDVIVSDTNLSEYVRNKWLQYAALHDFEVTYVVFATHFNDTFFGKNKNLVHRLPEHVLHHQYPMFSSFMNEAQDANINYIIV